MEQCPYCKQYVLESQKSEHKCKREFNSVKEIPVVFFYETQTEQGLPLIIARGFDGILYRLVKCNNPLADEKKHLKGTDDKGTEPASRNKSSFKTSSCDSALLSHVGKAFND